MALFGTLAIPLQGLRGVLHDAHAIFIRISLRIRLTRDRVRNLDRVGTYGRQVGQITDAMIVLVRHLPDRESLTRKESDVIKAFEKMADDIANIKEKHKRQAVRP